MRSWRFGGEWKRHLRANRGGVPVDVEFIDLNRDVVVSDRRCFGYEGEIRYFCASIDAGAR